MIPSDKLKALALRALKLKLKLDEVEAQYKEAQLAVMAQLIAENAFDPDTKAAGPVLLKITPNRYFDLETAKTLVKPEDVKASTVEVVDPKLLQQHMTPIQKEASMKSYPVPYKLGFAVNEVK